MPKEAKQTAEYDFKVVQEQATVRGKPVKFFANVREDNGEVLGMATEQYGIIQHPELIQAAEDALTKAGLSGYERRIVVTGNGERLYADYEFKNKTLATQVGDLFGFRLRFRNSFDKSLRASLSLGFLRLACLNGMATMEKEFGLTKKHSKGVTVEFISEAVALAMSKGQNALNIYNELAQVALTMEQGMSILSRLAADKAMSEKMAQNVKLLWAQPKRKEDEARNLYNLYNAVTEHLTHTVQANHFELAQRTSNDLLLRFANAARKAEYLTALLLPVEVPAVVVTADAPVTE